MKTVLVAAQPDEIAHALIEELKENHIVHTCSRAEVTVKLLDSLYPDVLILDLHLPHRGGFSVLEEASYRPPIIIALTRCLSDYILETAKSLSIHKVFILTSPISAIVDSLRE